MNQTTLDLQPANPEYTNCPTCGRIFSPKTWKRTRGVSIQIYCRWKCRRTPVRHSPDPSPEEIAGGYRRIALTQGQFTTIDATDFEWLSQWNWFASWDPCAKCFYVTREAYDPETKARKHMSMHRLIMGDPDSHVDHADLDTLNNRRYNLRLANRQQNGFNRSKLSNNRSGFKGVHAFKDKWMAQIRIDGKLRYLGTFTTPEAASEAYIAAVKETAGEFARW
jgi:HNH endonuclease